VQGLIEHIAIEHAVLDGFLDVLWFDFGLRLHVGDGTSHADDLVVSGWGAYPDVFSLTDNVLSKASTKGIFGGSLRASF
jgi:hypothetical protein